MSYLTLSQMVRDSDLIERITACAAALGHENPESVSRPHMWKYVVTDGWAKSYSTATDPAGADEAAVTDDMIRAAVERVIAELPPPDVSAASISLAE